MNIALFIFGLFFGAPLW